MGGGNNIAAIGDIVPEHFNMSPEGAVGDTGRWDIL